MRSIETAGNDTAELFYDKPTGAQDNEICTKIMQTNKFSSKTKHDVKVRVRDNENCSGKVLAKFRNVTNNKLEEFLELNKQLQRI